MRWHGHKNSQSVCEQYKQTMQNFDTGIVKATINFNDTAIFFSTSAFLEASMKLWEGKYAKAI